MIFSYCVGLPFFLFSLFQSLSLYHKLCHVEHLLPRTRSLWHSRELQSCMLSPLSFFSLFLCQIRTIIDLDKIKRRSCGSDVIWFTVNLYLDGTKFQRKAVCFCEECLVKTAREMVENPTSTLCMMMFTCCCLHQYSLVHLFPSGGVTSLHLHVSHLLCHTECVCASMHEPLCVIFKYACMIPEVFFFFWQTKMTVCSCVPLRPHRDVPLHVRTIPEPTAHWVKSPEESAQMSGWCCVLKCIMIDVIWHRQVFFFTQATTYIE